VALFFILGAVYSGLETSLKEIQSLFKSNTIQTAEAASLDKSSAKNLLLLKLFVLVHFIEGLWNLAMLYSLSVREKNSSDH
jgi:hypothetical protein